MTDKPHRDGTQAIPLRNEAGMSLRAEDYGIDNNWATDEDDSVDEERDGVSILPDNNPCWCLACLKQLPPDGMFPPIHCRFMVLCSICRNKRCPHAEDHRFECTGSNEPNQVPRSILPDEDGDCDIDLDCGDEPIDCLPPTWSDVLPAMADSPYWYPGDVDREILEMIDAD